MYDTSELAGRMIAKYGSRKAFAEHIGSCLSYVSEVLNGKRYLNQKTIDKWAIALDIQQEEISKYFFTKKVHETE